MDKQRVLEALNTLRAELADASGLDATARANLERMTAAIEKQLQTGVAPEGEDDPLAVLLPIAPPSLISDF